jgi:hypothetical protein
MKAKYQTTSESDEKLTANVIEPMYHGCKRTFVTVKYADLFYMYDEQNNFRVRYDFGMLDVKTYDWLMSVFAEVYIFFV